MAREKRLEYLGNLPTESAFRPRESCLVAPVKSQSIPSKTFHEDAPQLRHPVSEITSTCVHQSTAGGTYAFIQMQFLFEGEQSRSE